MRKPVSALKIHLLTFYCCSVVHSVNKLCVCVGACVHSLMPCKTFLPWCSSYLLKQAINMCVSSVTSVYVHTCTVLHVFSHYKQTPGPHIHTFMREREPGSRSRHSHDVWIYWRIFQPCLTRINSGLLSFAQYPHPRTPTPTPPRL